MAVKESKGNYYGTKVVTPVGRLSYPSLFTKAKPMEEGKEGKYELTLYIPKSEDISKLQAGLEEVGKAFYKENWKGLSKLQKCPIKDGDDQNDPNAKGHWVIRCNSSNKPNVVRADNSAIEGQDHEEVYGGCWGRASLLPASYSMPANKGLKFFLENVQKVKDGERFGNGRGGPAQNDFEAYTDSAAGTPAAAGSFDDEEPI